MLVCGGNDRARKNQKVVFFIPGHQAVPLAPVKQEIKAQKGGQPDHQQQQIRK